MKVAFVGCGGIGALHAHMANACGLRIVACADTAKDNAQAIADRYGATVVDPKKAAVYPEADIVAICTPTPFHTPYLEMATDAGKHVFCEKPFGRTIEQCKTAIANAKRTKGKVFVAHVVRYFQEFDAIKAQVEAGATGTPGFVKMYRGGIFPKGQGLWFHDYAMSGGVTLDTLIHDFDWLRYAFGDPERVFCQALQRTKPERLDYSLVTFRMKSGVIASVTGTWAHPQGFRVRVEVCGDKGIVSFDSQEASITTMLRSAPGEGPGMIVPGSPVAISPYQLEWQDFINWIEGKSKPRVTPQDGMAAVKMALGALESARTGKPVKL